VAGMSGGRRLLSLEGGNRGVVAQDVVLLKCYGDCNSALGIGCGANASVPVGNRVFQWSAEPG